MTTDWSGVHKRLCQTLYWHKQHSSRFGDKVWCSVRRTTWVGHSLFVPAYPCFNLLVEAPRGTSSPPLRICGIWMDLTPNLRHMTQTGFFSWSYWLIHNSNQVIGTYLQVFFFWNKRQREALPFFLFFFLDVGLRWFTLFESLCAAIAEAVSDHFCYVLEHSFLCDQVCTGFL